jgi:hypothetical protein
MYRWRKGVPTSRGATWLLRVPRSELGRIHEGVSKGFPIGPLAVLLDRSLALWFAAEEASVRPYDLISIQHAGFHTSRIEEPR